MPSLPLPRRAGGAQRRGSGIGPLLALFLGLTVVAMALASIVIADRREPETTESKANQLAPQLDRVRPGASDRRVRDAFGPPDQVIRNAPGSDYCLFYSNLPSVQPAYRFCFQGGKLELVSPQ